SDTSSINVSIRWSRGGATGSGAGAAAGAPAAEGLAAGGEAVVPIFASSRCASNSRTAAVISQAGRLNKRNFGLAETDRVLKINASLPRSRLMLSSPSWSDSDLYVLTFIGLRLLVKRSEGSAEFHSVKRPQAEA